MSMLILVGVTLILWGIAGVLIFTPVRTKANRWYGGYLFSVSLGLLVAIFKEFKEFITPAALVQIALLELVIHFLCAASFRFSPYLILRASLSYSAQLNRKWEQRLGTLLLIPVLVTFLLDWIIPQSGALLLYLDYSPLFWTVVIWAVPYGISANLLFFQAYHNESNMTIKRQKLLVFIVTLLPWHYYISAILRRHGGVTIFGGKT